MSRPDESLAFHATAPDGAEGYVLLVEAASVPGRVLVRRWRSPDYTTEAPRRERDASDVRADLARQAREGWRFTLPADRLFAWLDALGA